MKPKDLFSIQNQKKKNRIVHAGNFKYLKKRQNIKKIVLRFESTY